MLEMVFLSEKKFDTSSATKKSVIQNLTSSPRITRKKMYVESIVSSIVEKSDLEYYTEGWLRKGI